MPLILWPLEIQLVTLLMAPPMMYHVHCLPLSGMELAVFHALKSLTLTLTDAHNVQMELLSTLPFVNVFLDQQMHQM